MKSTLLRDRKWLGLMISSILLAAIAIFQVFKETDYNNDYIWVGPAFFSIWQLVLAVKRVKELKSQDNT